MLEHSLHERSIQTNYKLNYMYVSCRVEMITCFVIMMLMLMRSYEIPVISSVVCCMLFCIISSYDELLYEFDPRIYFSINVPQTSPPDNDEFKNREQTCSVS